MNNIIRTADDDSRYSAVLALLARLSAFLTEASKTIYELAGAPLPPAEGRQVDPQHGWAKMREPRPYGETEADVVRERMHVARECEVHDKLNALHLSAEVEGLLSELEQLKWQYLNSCEDFMLKVAGELCMEYEQPDLWRAIFTAARAGSCVDIDDEKRFLDHNFDSA